MKTYKQKRKRRRARFKERIFSKKKRVLHIQPSKKSRQREYVIFDDKNKAYFSMDSSVTSDIRYAKKSKDVDFINRTISEIKHTGAWRPIRVKQQDIL